MEKTTTKSLIITYGLLLGVLSVLSAVVKYVISGNATDKSVLESIIGIVMTIALIVIPINIHKKNNQGFLTLSDSFKIGLGVSAIAGIIGVIYFVIFANYIQPEFAENLLNSEVKKSMESNPNLSAADMQKGMAMAKSFMMPMFYTMIIVANLFFGFLISLIAGLVLRKQQ